jgi:23S rRNA pseudouridine955/2504/2580 synthase/23S rRNA pseudouridine1911/1915/1917 synthase
MMADQGIIDEPLFTQSTGKVILSKRGKSSQTQWNLLERFQHHSLIEAHPLTGRTHQIRVHLAASGHPLVGDMMYGSKGPLYLSSLKGKHRYRLSKDTDEERPLLSRIALHASGITFLDYTTHQPISVESPLHKDMYVAVTKLRQYSGFNK